MVLIFLLSLFSVAQFTLSNALSSRDSAIPLRPSALASSTATSASMIASID